jgi:hypothetical protein
MTDKVRADGLVEIPEHKWYEVFDKLSRVDDLLEILIRQVDYTNSLIGKIAGSITVTTPTVPTAGAGLAGLVLLDYTTTPLPKAVRAIWISRVDDDPMTDRIVGTVYSDAEGILYVEQSPDGENWDVSTKFEVSPSLLKNSFGFSVEKVAQYARVRYIDMTRTTDVGQTTFRLYVYAKRRWLL